MIDIDEHIEMWEHDLLGRNGVADLMDVLIAILRDELNYLPINREENGDE